MTIAAPLYRESITVLVIPTFQVSAQSVLIKDNIKPPAEQVVDDLIAFIKKYI